MIKYNWRYLEIIYIQDNDETKSRNDSDSSVGEIGIDTEQGPGVCGGLVSLDPDYENSEKVIHVKHHATRERC